MDLNAVLLWMVCLSCVTFVLRFSKSSATRGWAIVAAIILAITFVLWTEFPAQAGLWGGGLWILFMLVPTVSMAVVNNLAARQKYRSARLVATGLKFLHPLDGLWQYPLLFRALELGQNGELDQAIAVLAKYPRHDRNGYQNAQALTFRIKAEWDQLLVWLQAEYNSATSKSSLAAYYARALAETGKLNTLLEMLDYYEHQNAAIRIRDLLLIRIFALAFCGETEQLARLLSDRRLKHFLPEAQQFWLATAAMVAGAGTEQEIKAKQQLEQLAADTKDAMLKRAIDWRLTQPLANPDQVLTPVSQKVLQDTALESAHEAKYSGALAFTSERIYVSYVLIGLNLAMFALEIAFGGSTDLGTLYQLGALDPIAVRHQGEWWRLVNAMFLHYGYIHLFMNMIGLYFLGGFVETSLGWWRYLLVYLFSGIGSMLTVTIVAFFVSPELPQITVGASGAIMGMVGATGALLWLAWQRERAKVAARRLRTVLFIIGLQVFFDFAVPNVSFVGHTSGLILGAIAGWLVAPRHSSTSEQR
ncbi:Peptidase S54, rhomboid domain protein [Thalassoporum mexicanum PCC 7367]|uniref:rhomboid family intramembrane serine protease n=1 Tax=Thalassoporum mexicanum TaxID=3457544 RepID=UPI00029FF6B3|nr:rhomboid family intramembrane serine protease [Pseudanabaena sp. PCC 7367]AFY68637.1 Peptidase S54, rhomboid domain protein [Pseudanabaena sp. PCC 7367]